MQLFQGLLAVLAPACAVADSVHIDPHADLLYRQALNLLDQSDTQSLGFSLKTATAAQAPAQPGQSLGRSQAAAVSLLKKAVEHDHPVARYRLALYYINELPASQIPAVACPLLQDSLAQGFAPAALGIEAWCVDYRQSHAFAESLENIPDKATRYASYYPQPAERLPCSREQPKGLAMQWGRQRDYRAEIYRLLGNIDADQRQRYWHKAVDLNGCFAINQRLLSSQH